MEHWQGLWRLDFSAYSYQLYHLYFQTFVFSILWQDQGVYLQTEILKNCPNVFAHLFICSFLQLVRLLWSALSLSGATLVNNMPSAHFLPLCTQLRCSGVKWSRMTMKGEKIYFQEPLWYSVQEKYPLCTLPETIDNGNCWITFGHISYLCFWRTTAESLLITPI